MTKLSLLVGFTFLALTGVAGAKDISDILVNNNKQYPDMTSDERGVLRAYAVERENPKYYVQTSSGGQREVKLGEIVRWVGTKEQWVIADESVKAADNVNPPVIVASTTIGDIEGQHPSTGPYIAPGIPEPSAHWTSEFIWIKDYTVIHGHELWTLDEFVKSGEFCKAQDHRWWNDYGDSICLFCLRRRKWVKGRWVVSSEKGRWQP